MRRLQLDRDIKPLSEFRANVGSCIQQVHTTRRPLVITQHGKSAAVLLDVMEYEALMERLELLDEIQLAERQIEEGKGIGHEDARQAVLRRLKK
jgi:prevent-host-death family protein